MPGHWPLVGRREELELVKERLTGSGQITIALAGAAGVGKTRLAAEVLELLTQEGFEVARAAASRAASSIPFGALAQLVTVSGRGRENRAALLRRAAAEIEHRGTNKRVVLFVDDAHLLDATSATLVHQLAQGSSVSVFLTIRTGEPVVDPIAFLWKDGLAERIELQPLSKIEVEALLESALGGHADGHLVQQVFAASRGNPLFVRELVLGGVASLAVREEAGVWRLAGHLEAPARLVELIESRLSDVDGDDLAILETLAVAEAMGQSALEARFGTEAIERLERSGHLTIAPDGRRRVVGFSHPLHGEVIRAAMTSHRRAAVGRLVADLIEGAGARRRGDRTQVALLRLDADGDADAGVLSDAATEANFARDLVLSERLARAAIRAGAGWQTSRLLGDVLRWQGRYGEAEEVLGSIDPSLASTDEDRSLLAMARGENLFRGLGRYDEAIAVIEGAESCATDEEWKAELVALRASLNLLAGRVSAALEIASPIADRPAGRATVLASEVVAAGLAVTGQGERALPIADRGFQAQLTLGDQPQMNDLGSHLMMRCLALAELGRLGEAETQAQMVYDLAIADGLLVGRAWFAMILGRVALGAGRLARAEALFRESALAFRDINDPGPESWAWAAAVQAVAARGDVGGAEAASAEMEATAPSLVTLMQVEVGRARAWAAAARGEHSRAREILLRAAGEGRTLGQFALEADALHDVARLGGARDVVDRIEELAAVVQGPLAGARAAHVRALAQEDAPALEDASSVFEGLGAILLAAEAAAQASDVWRRTGQARRAVLLVNRARELAKACGGARTPALEQAGRVVSLTPREREIASLATQGTSSKEIAERLVLSVRTVNNTLQRVYQKLGIESRGELASALEGEVES